MGAPLVRLCHALYGLVARGGCDGLLAVVASPEQDLVEHCKLAGPHDGVSSEHRAFRDDGAQWLAKLVS